MKERVVLQKMSIDKYKIIAICGKAGSGKDTALQSVLSAEPSFHEIISCTTRPIREGEVNGKNYWFITKEEMENKVLANEMLEVATFNDWIYGTPISSLDKNKINIGVFNLDGIDFLTLDPRIDVRICYVTCDDKLRLYRQLDREEHPDVAEIVRRYTTDEKDFKFIYNEFDVDLTINNEELQDLYRVRDAIIDLGKSF